ncbi:MAG: D-alanyl-D-alanine carboxypeptidase family protein [Patescibacteria group bacterium]|nr:D-alanyl-D-alanine carboxypeptidase family protein [Patescibacteria group bacterium]
MAVSEIKPGGAATPPKKPTTAKTPPSKAPESSPNGSPAPNVGGGPQQSERVNASQAGPDAPKDPSGPTAEENPETNPSGGPSRAEKFKQGAKDKASNASQRIKDAKSVAKATTGVPGKEDADDVKKAYQEKGAAGAAGEVGRKAVGKGVTTAVDATGVGLVVGAKVGKFVEKALKKENLKWVGLIAVLPIVMVSILVVIVVYAFANPTKFISQVVSDPKIREFALQAAAGLGKNIFSQEETLKKYGYVEYKSGSAIAAPDAKPPVAGSLEDKISRIDLKNAQYQTTQKPGCPISYTTKTLIGPGGKTVNVLDKATDNKGQEVSNDNYLTGYCIINSMPLYNMMVRSQAAREVNSFSDTFLSYADVKNYPKNSTREERAKYTHDKTYGRITSKAEQNPESDVPKINEYVAKVREVLKNNTDPNAVYAVDEDFTFGDVDQVRTMCAFAQGYFGPLDRKNKDGSLKTGANNIRKGIDGRLNTGQRSGVKWNTLSSTRELGLVSNEETGDTLRQLDGWVSSTAYAQNVYSRQTGKKANPESLSNTSYGANYQNALSILYDTREYCAGEIGKADRSTIENNYNTLKDAIISQSNGGFESPEGFGDRQLMQGVIRMIGGSAISGLEPGPNNFNNMSQGFRGLSNQYMMSIGGRFLNSKESNSLALKTENTSREIESKNGLAYRLYGKDNIRSLANTIQYETPRTTGELNTRVGDFIASVGNPIKMIADLHSSFSYLALGKNTQAFAASNIGDAYMRVDTVGIPESDFVPDQIANSDDIQKMQESGTYDQKRALRYFEACSKSNIPSKAYFLRLKVVGDDGELGNRKVRDGAGYPYYPAMADIIEYEDYADRKDIKDEKRAFIACEIYLNPDTDLILDERDRKKLVRDTFGDELGTDGMLLLAKKYRNYLYANSIADLMVELSSTEKTDSIYQNPNGEANENATATSTAGGAIVGDPYAETVSVACAAGTKDIGIQDAYLKGVKTESRMCSVSNIPSIGKSDNPGGQFPTPGADGHVVVNSRVSGAWYKLAEDAKAAGINLKAISSFRSMASQEVLWARYGRDPQRVARPGTSPHQAGVAIDFDNMEGYRKNATCSNRATNSSPAYQWLRANSINYGFKQYATEAWHWDALPSANRCGP